MCSTRRARARRQVFQRLFEQREEAVNFSGGVLVGLGRRGGIVQDRVDQNRDGLLRAVEDEQLVGDEEIERGRAQLVLRRARDDGLDVVDELVADEAHRAAGEAREAGDVHGPVAREHALDDFEAVANALVARLLAGRGDGELLDDLAVRDDLDAVGGLLDDGARVAADEGVAAQMLTTLDGLEQE